MINRTEGVSGTLKEVNDSAFDLESAEAALVLQTSTQTKASALQRLKVWNGSRQLCSSFMPANGTQCSAIFS